jgi:hypothetical protein
MEAYAARAIRRCHANSIRATSTPVALADPTGECPRGAVPDTCNYRETTGPRDRSPILLGSLPQGLAGAPKMSGGPDSNTAPIELLRGRRTRVCKSGRRVVPGPADQGTRRGREITVGPCAIE